MDFSSDFRQRTFRAFSPRGDLLEIGLVDRTGMAAKRSQPSMAFSTASAYNSSLFSFLGQETVLASLDSAPFSENRQIRTLQGITQVR